jgi:hypothetical protein
MQKNKLSLHANTIFSCFIYFIILVKCLFLFFVIWNFYLKKKNGGGNDRNETKLQKKVLYYRNLMENIFIILVSLLLIYLFNPYHDNKYLDNKKVKILFFIYGVLMLVTFDWSEFVAG